MYTIGPINYSPPKYIPGIYVIKRGAFRKLRVHPCRMVAHASCMVAHASCTVGLYDAARETAQAIISRESPET